MTREKNPLVVTLYDKEKNKTVENYIDDIFLTLGGIEKVIPENSNILIKPNFVAPFPKATTNVDLIDALISKLKSRANKIVIAESSGFEFNTDTTFNILGIKEVAQKHAVPIINFEDCQFQNIKTGDPIFPVLKMPDILNEYDYFINMPKLKGHALTKVTFGMKNLFGVIHRDSRRIIHSRNLEHGIAVLNKVLIPDLTIVDGLWTLDKAVYSEAQYKGILIAGEDVRLVDYICCRTFGTSYLDVPHINKHLDDTLISKLKLDTLYGKIPGVENRLSNSKKRKYFVQNFFYQTAYILDRLLLPFRKGKSIIPEIHLHLGVKPKIDKSKCTKCEKCIPVCPVNAIDSSYKIDYQKCKFVRCLKCKEICPEDAVILKGFHK